jgi:hypothetical protein
MLFIHAMGIQAGALLNPREREAPTPAVEVTAPKANAPDGRSAENQGLQQRAERGNRGGGSGEHGDRTTVQPAGGGNRVEAARPAGGGRPQSQGFADIKVDLQTRRYIHIASLLLVFGSYLYLRLRKAKQDAATRRTAQFCA